MEEKIEKIIEKYWDDNEEYYSSVRYEGEDENEFWLKDELELFLKETGVKYQIKKEDGFDSPGYENEFLALAYMNENNELKLHTIVMECF